MATKEPSRNTTIPLPRQQTTANLKHCLFVYTQISPGSSFISMADSRDASLQDQAFIPAKHFGHKNTSQLDGCGPLPAPHHWEPPFLLCH
eukprot:6792968-Ditylum_brightwellii.AAC.1